jgi:hypothetical protein
MPITTTWLDSEQTIAHVACSGMWTEDDVQTVVLAGEADIRRRQLARVDTIVDLRASTRPLYTINLARVTMPLRHAPLCDGLFIIVLETSIPPLLVNALQALMLRGRTAIHVTRSLEDARQIVADIRAQLSVTR